MAQSRSPNYASHITEVAIIVEDVYPPAGSDKKEALTAWAERVFRDAALSPTPDQIREIAKTVAGLILTQRLVPYAQSNGANLFEGWLGETHVGPPNILERIDGACSILTVMLADTEVQRDDSRRASVESRIFREINEIIVDELGASLDEFVDGVREEFGPTSSREPADSSAAGSVATAGGGCALVAIGALALASTAILLW